MRYLLIFLAVIGLDRLAKVLVQSHLWLGQSIPLIDNLVYLTYVHNQGGAFGILAGRGSLFLVAAVAVIFVSTYYVIRYRPGTRLESALAMVAGGAAGNFIDRVYLDGVVDFIDLGFWPVFNLADCAIVLGAAWLFWVVAYPQRSERAYPWK